MRPTQAWLLVVTYLAGVWVLRGLAQDALGPMAPPWRPIPELPALLWYTELDENADEAKNLFLNGDIVAHDPFNSNDAAGKKAVRPPWRNDRYIVLRKTGWGQDEERKVCFTIKLNTTKLRVPDGTFDPNRVFIRFSIWANEPGKVTVMVKAGAKFSDGLTVPRPDQWCPLKVSFGALANRGDRMRPDSLVQEVRFTFAPSRAWERLPEVCIDKVILCHQVPPDRVALMLMAWQAMMSKLTKSLATDGFCYNDKMHVAMRKLTRQGNHRGPALVFMPPFNANGDLSALLNSAAQGAKLRGTRFEVAQDPRTFPLSELKDARAFLPYLLAKTDPRAAMLVLAREDAVLSGTELESLRLILERLLASHCMPMLYLPAVDENDRKLAEFHKAAVKLCDDWGVPYADQGFAFKGVARPYADGKLTPEGQKALSVLLMASYKHVQEAVNPRR